MDILTKWLKITNQCNNKLTEEKKAKNETGTWRNSFFYENLSTSICNLEHKDNNGNL